MGTHALNWHSLFCHGVLASSTNPWVASQRVSHSEGLSHSQCVIAKHSWHVQGIWGDCLGTPNPYNLSEKYWQSISNLYRNTPPTCNAVPCWLLNFGERETLQYTSNLYRSTPPICAAICLAFAPAILLRKYPGLGVPESS